MKLGWVKELADRDIRRVFERLREVVQRDVGERNSVPALPPWRGDFKFVVNEERRDCFAVNASWESEIPQPVRTAIVLFRLENDRIHAELVNESGTSLMFTVSSNYRDGISVSGSNVRAEPDDAEGVSWLALEELFFNPRVA